MRKNIGRFSCLSAMTALIVVGGGGGVAHADWVAVGQGISANLQVRATYADVKFHDSEGLRIDNPPIEYTPQPVRGLFKWEGNGTPPNQTSVTHTLRVAGGRTTYKDPQSSAVTVLCYIGVNGANYADLKEQDGPQSIEHSDPMPITFTQQQSFTFFRDPITAQYEMPVEFSGISLKAYSSAYGLALMGDEENPGMAFFAGQGDASTTKSTLDTVSISVTP